MKMKRLAKRLRKEEKSVIRKSGKVGETEL